MTAHRPLDRRSRRSRAALESALLELIAAERDLAQISVSDVTGRADVHRSTFYEHYTDVHDLAAAAATTMFDELMVATAQLSADRQTDAAAGESLTGMFAHVAEHQRLYRALLGPDGGARVINHLLDRTAGSVRRGLAETPAGDAPSREEHAPLSVFLAGALIGTIIDWLRRGCPETPAQLSAATWPYLLAASTTHLG